ncbi:MAG: 2-succinyl-5-enolpyruvyl-6-hydroxy-3-cyclohexene-1-carboxylic-acid synthase [Verrucomicrobiota bacterium]
MSESGIETIWERESVTYSNLNTYWGHLFIDKLKRSGISRFVVSPGSRNTPLVFAASRISDIEIEVVVDERSAAFFALGWSKASYRSPVALICTSGSALAHYTPAMVEARYSHIPLLVISADRPSELQECHAGQTINQSDFFGVYAEESHSFPEPALDTWLTVETQINSLCKQLLHPSSFGSQINLPFRDPLTPGVEDGDRYQYFKHHKTTQAAHKSEVTSRSIADFSCEFSYKTIIIVGPHCYGNEITDTIECFLKAYSDGFRGIVLCDGLSGFRFGAAKTIAHYDLFLRESTKVDLLKPDAVILLGDLPTSKPLRAAIERWTPSIHVLAFDNDKRSAGIPGDWTHHTFQEAQGFDLFTQPLRNQQTEKDFRAKWIAYEDACIEQLDHYDYPKAVVEWLIPREVCRHTHDAKDIWISSSMPVRDWEAFAGSRSRDFRVFVNRGANGIDGIVASAAGMTRGGARSGLLIIGDVALSHDIGSLALLNQRSTPLDILVILNGGGRIFEHLPISEAEVDFEKFYLTPPTIDLQKVSEAHGIVFKEIKDFHELENLIKTPTEGHRMIAIKTDASSDLLKRRAFIKTLNEQI